MALFYVPAEDARKLMAVNTRGEHSSLTVRASHLPREVTDLPPEVLEPTVDCILYPISYSLDDHCRPTGHHSSRFLPRTITDFLLNYRGPKSPYNHPSVFPAFQPYLAKTHSSDFENLLSLKGHPDQNFRVVGCGEITETINKQLDEYFHLWSTP